MNILATSEPRLSTLEHGEALVAGLLGSIKSLEDFMQKNRNVDLSDLQADLDDAYNRCLDLLMASTRVQRRAKWGLNP